MAMKFSEWEARKADYIVKIEDQLGKYPRYGATIGEEHFSGNDAEPIIASVKAKVPAGEKPVIRSMDSLRTLDQGKMHIWRGWDEREIRAWMSEATLESGAKELFRKDCVEDQRAEEAGGK